MHLWEVAGGSLDVVHEGNRLLGVDTINSKLVGVVTVLYVNLTRQCPTCSKYVSLSVDSDTLIHVCR